MRTALCAAVESGQVGEVKRLLSLGANPDEWMVMINTRAQICMWHHVTRHHAHTPQAHDNSQGVLSHGSCILAGVS